MRLTETARQLQLQKWATLIQEYKESGMKLIDWLHENNISKDQYYYWRRQLKETIISTSEYYVAAEPPVRCGESHHSGQTEPPYY